MDFGSKLIHVDIDNETEDIYIDEVEVKFSFSVVLFFFILFFFFFQKDGIAEGAAKQAVIWAEAAKEDKDKDDSFLKSIFDNVEKMV